MAKRIAPWRFNWPTIRSKRPPRKVCPIESWRDADLADKTARRNAGLDDSDAHNVSIGMALINYRLEHIQLPKDALPE